MEQIREVIQLYYFFSIVAFLCCVVTGTGAVFYYKKKKVRETIGFLNGSKAKQEIDALKKANKEKRQRTVFEEGEETALLRLIPFLIILLFWKPSMCYAEELTEEMCRINDASIMQEAEGWYLSVDSIAFPSDSVKYIKVKKGTEYILGTETEYACTDFIQQTEEMKELLKNLNESGRYKIQMAEKDEDGRILAETDPVFIRVDAENPTEIKVEEKPEDRWTNQPVQIRVSAKDDKDGSGIKEYQYVLNEEGFDGTEEAGMSRDGVISLSKPNTVIEKVWVRAVDRAGRAGKAKKIEIKYDSQRPSCTEFHLTGGRHVRVTGKIMDSGSGIQKIECKVQCSSSLRTFGNEVRDYPILAYEYKKGESVQKDFQLYETWKDLTGNISCRVKVTDLAGNVTEYPGSGQEPLVTEADNVIPEGEVYLSYEKEYTLDGTDSDRLSEKSEEKLFFLQNALKTHKVYLYGYDRHSPIKEIEVEYGGISIRLPTVMEKENQYAVKEIDGKDYHYVCLELPSVILEQPFHENQIQVCKITDTAGNVRTFEKEEGRAATKLIGDSINPKLEMERRNEKDRWGNHFYFQGDGRALFSIYGEKYFEKGKLETIVNGKKENGWIKNEKDGYSWELQKEEDEKLEEKKEVRIRYTDPNGNLLYGAEENTGIVEAGEWKGSFIFDEQEPLLWEFELEGDYKLEDGVFYYTHKDKFHGVTGHMVIEENYLDFNSEDVVLLAMCQNGNQAKIPVPVQWTTQKEKQKRQVGTFSFNQEGKYKFILKVKDRSKNKMKAGTGSGLQVMDGRYESSSFVIDHTAPVLQEVSYGMAEEVTDLSGNRLSLRYPAFGTVSYYQREQTITIKIKEENFSEKNFVFWINGKQMPKEQVTWKQEGVLHTGTVFLEAKEGRYQVSCTYRDQASIGLCMDQAMDAKLFDEEKHRYQGPVFVIDTKNPVIRFETDRKIVRVIDGREYYQEGILFRTEVEDENFKVTDDTVQCRITAKDASDRERKEGKKLLEQWNRQIREPSNWKQAGNRWIFDFILDVDANYTIAMSCQDLSGRKAEDVTKKITIDSRQPYIEHIVFKKVTTGKLADSINYMTYGYFTNDRIQVEITYKDDNSDMIHVGYVAKENGREVELQKEKMIEKASERKVSFLLPENFKGHVTVWAEDRSGNLFSKTYPGLVSENSKKHRESGNILIESEIEPNQNGFYQSSVPILLKIRDTHSGIKNYCYTAGRSAKDCYSFEKETGKDLQKKAKEPEHYVWEKKIVLKGKENDQNDVKVKVEYEDNAGNRTYLEKEYQIDVTKPEIQVTYDNDSAQNQTYYREDRMATITVKERNFHEDDFHVIVTSTGEKPQISPWKHTPNGGKSNEALHSCTVRFEKDGDYTLTVAGKDRAGNQAEYERIDRFTIDQTAPILSVSYSNQDVQNERYYKAPRTAHITIQEHNFMEQGVKVTMNQKGNGKQVEVPQVEYQAGADDKNTASIEFSSDGEYSWEIRCTDKAGNRSEIYKEKPFIVDLTKPVVTISDVEHQGAYRGKIAPGVEFTDVNCDIERSEITIVGYKTGKRKFQGTNRLIPHGRRIKWDDFEKKRNTDDVYVLKADIFDKAGNVERAQIRFSINRFGSVYQLHQDTKVLADRYYTKEAKTIKITEINVNKLREQEVSYQKDGKVYFLKADRDYKIEEKRSQTKWQEYQYEIPASVFEKEGAYEVCVYSKDGAGNVSDNVIKGAPVRFAVDRTKPSVVLTGVEEKARYHQAIRKIRVDVKDNLKIDSLQIYYGNRRMQFSSQQLQKMGGVVTIHAEASPRWQQIYVKAVDMAGNSRITKPVEFLLTDNVWIQFYHNKPAFYLTLTFCIIWTIILGNMVKRIKKERRNDAKR